LGNIDAAKFCRPRILGQRQARADTDIENPAADPVGLGYGGLTALFENLAEHEIVDRRPASIGLCDPFPVDIAPHAPCPNFFLDCQSCSSGCRLASRASLRAAALLIKPPPSTRACPEGAS